MSAVLNGKYLRGKEGEREEGEDDGRYKLNVYIGSHSIVAIRNDPGHLRSPHVQTRNDIARVLMRY